MWQLFLQIRAPRPLARAAKRRSVGPCSTKIRVTRSSSISAPSLCSAFAIADSSALRINPAAFFGEKRRMFSALSIGLPRTRSATRRPFCAEIFAPRIDALVSISNSPGCARLLLARRRRSLAIGRMALERARHRELAQLVADHLVVDVDRHVLLSVVHGDRQPDEIPNDGRASRPGLDRALVLGGLRGLDLLQHVPVDKRAFLQ